VIKLRIRHLGSLHQIISPFLFLNLNLAYGKGRYKNSAILVALGIIIILHVPLHKIMSEDTQYLILNANMIDD
jgi:hypothetical protein